MSTKKGNRSKGRTKVKGLPTKDKKLSSTDLKKIKGGVIGSCRRGRLQVQTANRGLVICALKWLRRSISQAGRGLCDRDQSFT